jgi:hypothetical protein
VRQRFTGEITGVGTTSGVRLVVGDWYDSPLGRFTDVMVQEPDGHRVLLAPGEAEAALVSTVYSFDEVVVGPVTMDAPPGRRVVAASDLELEVALGGRTLLGRLLRLVPRPLATDPRWLALLAPVARLGGVTTHGSAGGGRTESYGAYDARAVTGASGRWRGRDLGGLAAVDPPVTFGFSSTLRRPSLTRLVTTIDGP